MREAPATPQSAPGAPPAPGAGLPMPRLVEFEAPARWQAIDFVSDLHLDAQHPATFAAFASHLRHTTADAVFVLGDLFEAWVGDDARGSGLGRRVLEAFQEASCRLGLALMVGNRDFLIGQALLREAGMIGLADPTVLLAHGRRLLLSHGDALCLEDSAYQHFRAQVRTEAWRDAFLAQPLDTRLHQAAQMRAASRARQAAGQPETWADVDPDAARQWLQATGADTLIHGHTHRPGEHALGPRQRRVVLSDWDCDGPGPARAEVLRLDARGLHRLAPAHA